MKKGLLTSYIDGITDLQYGESYSSILRYVLPELTSTLLLYSLPLLVDSYFISQLASTSLYATLGATNTIMYFITKVAESLAVGVVILSGQENGKHAFSRVGAVLKDTFWVTCLVGFCFSAMLYVTAESIFGWYGVSTEMMAIGVPFLRMRAIGVFFIFLYLALVGFLRGVKNTHTPMTIFIFGSLLFLFFDYVFIFGALGCPRMELQGSALASLLQYAVMSVAALGYILTHAEYKKYVIHLFANLFQFSYAKRLVLLSGPVMIDKATMAWSYIWLCKMINPMGAAAVASYCVVRDIARCMFLPAMASAQVVTFLVSNDVGMGDWQAAKSNLKKVCFIASVLAFTTLLAFTYNPKWIISIFDKKGEFTPLALHALPIIGVLVFFDLVQLILAGALRGAGNVKVVMYVRLAICFGYFVPLSFFLSQLQIEQSLKFILVYGSFYVGNALMGVAYINRFRSDEWKMPSLKGSV